MNATPETHAAAPAPVVAPPKAKKAKLPKTPKPKKEKAPRAPGVVRLVTRPRVAAVRLTKHLRSLAKIDWDACGADGARGAIAVLENVAAKLLVATPARRSFGVGDDVAVRPKARAHCATLLDAADIDAPLVVVAVRGNKVVCQTASGEKCLLPRAHVVAVAEVTS